jgi:hypothetical protein
VGGSDIIFDFFASTSHLKRNKKNDAHPNQV